MTAWLGEFWGALAANLKAPQWWATEAASWFIFSLLVTVLVMASSLWVQSRRKRPYDGWKLIVRSDVDTEQSLHWEEVQRFATSEFEMTKFTKSVLSNYGQLRGRAIFEAHESGWLSRDEKAKVIIIDLNKISGEAFKLHDAPATSGGQPASASDGSTGNAL